MLKIKGNNFEKTEQAIECYNYCALIGTLMPYLTASNSCMQVGQLISVI